jgi:hypothetical protein
MISPFGALEFLGGEAFFFSPSLSFLLAGVWLRRTHIIVIGPARPLSYPETLRQ